MWQSVLYSARVYHAARGHPKSWHLTDLPRLPSEDCWRSGIMSILNIYDQIKSGEIIVPRVGAPLEWRFWKHVNKDGPLHPEFGQCWLWTGAKTANGYGVLKITSGLLYCHRYSYQIHLGSADGSDVLHRCDRPWCVNPHHLFLGSQQDNVFDMVVKQRQSRGETNGNNKLTDDIVRYCRSAHIKGHKTYGGAALARRFEVTTGVMLDAIYGRSWSHVTSPSTT